MSRPNKTNESRDEFIKGFSDLCRLHGILIDSNSNGDLCIYKKSGGQWRRLGFLYYEFDEEQELPNYLFTEKTNNGGK